MNNYCYHLRYMSNMSYMINMLCNILQNIVQIDSTQIYYVNIAFYYCCDLLFVILFRIMYNIAHDIVP